MVRFHALHDSRRYTIPQCWAPHTHHTQVHGVPYGICRTIRVVLSKSRLPSVCEGTRLTPKINLMPARSFFCTLARHALSALDSSTVDMEEEQLWTGYMRSRYEVQVGSEGWAVAAAQSLEHNGFCVLRSSARVAPLELCARCTAVALSTLDRLLKAIELRGVDPIQDLFRFREVCKRHGGARYDVALPHAMPPPAADAAAAVAVEPPLQKTADDAADEPGDAAGPWSELHALVDAAVAQLAGSGL
jgi:hypothetical protein